jgi:ribonuclease III
MSRAGKPPDEPPARDELPAALGVVLKPELLDRALTHRSFAYEHGGLPTNERLEFLGDSVLGLVVTDALYQRHPDLPEGQLAKLRAAVVNMRALAGVARGLGLGAHLKLGRGEETSGGRDKSSILADTLEALFGAVYLEHGIEVASLLVRRLVDPMMDSTAAYGPGLDWKTSLQELTAAESLGVPEYAVTEEGPDHAKEFHATALVQGLGYGTGSGRSKKEAEQAAAEAAFNRLAAERNAAGKAGSNGAAKASSNGSAVPQSGGAPATDPADPADPADPTDPDGSDGSAEPDGTEADA